MSIDKIKWILYNDYKKHKCKKMSKLNIYVLHLNIEQEY